jgi:uncharacterized protein (TIGR02996 family)
MTATQHPDWPAFLAAIIADPADDTVRLAAADFMEENCDPDRAAFIRIQIELARLVADGDGKDQDTIDRLRLKEREFLGPLSVNAKLWAAEACPELVALNFGGDGRESLDMVRVAGAERLTWERGFIDGVRCPAELWARHGAAIRRRQPIRRVILTSCERVGRGQWYAIIPTIRKLRVVALQGVDQSMARWLKGWLVDGEELLVL